MEFTQNQKLLFASIVILLSCFQTSCNSSNIQYRIDEEKKIIKIIDVRSFPFCDLRNSKSEFTHQQEFYDRIASYNKEDYSIKIKSENEGKNLEVDIVKFYNAIPHYDEEKIEKVSSIITIDSFWIEFLYFKGEIFFPIEAENEKQEILEFKLIVDNPSIINVLNKINNKVRIIKSSQISPEKICSHGYIGNSPVIAISSDLKIEDVNPLSLTYLVYKEYSKLLLSFNEKGLIDVSSEAKIHLFTFMNRLGVHYLSDLTLPYESFAIYHKINGMIYTLANKNNEYRYMQNWTICISTPERNMLSGVMYPKSVESFYKYSEDNYFDL